MSPPKRYALSVEVKLVELPNQFDEPEQDFSATDDPMKMIGQIMGKMDKVAISHPLGFQQPAGFDFRRAATISVHHFAGLAKIISQYDELTQQIESERP